MKNNSKYVYLLKDINGNTVDVGESIEPLIRLYYKTHVLGQRLYGIKDLTIEIVAGPMSNKKARALERALKVKHNLELTEYTRCTSICTASRKITYLQAQEIRNKYIPRKYTMKMLAAEYNISQPAILQVLEYKTYKTN